MMTSCSFRLSCNRVAKDSYSTTSLSCVTEVHLNRCREPDHQTVGSGQRIVRALGVDPGEQPLDAVDGETQRSRDFGVADEKGQRRLAMHPGRTAATIKLVRPGHTQQVRPRKAWAGFRGVSHCHPCVEQHRLVLQTLDEPAQLQKAPGVVPGHHRVDHAREQPQAVGRLKGQLGRILGPGSCKPGVWDVRRSCRGHANRAPDGLQGCRRGASAGTPAGGRSAPSARCSVPSSRSRRRPWLASARPYWSRRIQRSLHPPPWLEFTTRPPFRRATRQSPPGEIWMSSRPRRTKGRTST